MLWFGKGWPEILAPILGAALGVWIVLRAGDVAASRARTWIREDLGQTEAGDRRARRVGYVERACVGVLTVTLGPVFGLGSIVPLIALKLKANWGSKTAKIGGVARAEVVRVGGISAIVGSLVSMTIAVLGALLVRECLPL